MLAECSPVILVINCGSSTLKYQLYTTDLKVVTAKGLISKIGEDGSRVEHAAHGSKHVRVMPVPDHHTAFTAMIDRLIDPEVGVIKDISEVTAVGHRAVHGADTFVKSSVINDEVIAKLEECVPLAPLHNPPNLVGIVEARKLLPDVPQVVVFDTAFHQTMPEYAHVYALPYELYSEHRIRRYGFHGTSCRFVNQRAADMLGRPVDELKMVICHLGNGVTIDAIENGRSVDTSIGFATFSGVMMGTRSGDVDPGLIFYLNKQLGMSLGDIEAMLYKRSGLLGVSGISNDMREVEERAEGGCERCELALEMFAYMTRKYIGSYAAALGGLDALVFTAGIGENSPSMRARICEKLGFLGIAIDSDANEAPGDDGRISTRASRTAAMVVPTDEEKMIAIDTLRLTEKARAAAA
ncbi:acetate kinase [Afifella marina DSM 2698]|uniref:Acetate kinase n=1 Tax=Afifella marina DSM 2698 TaxID=1120955 RepID=A0A1G5NWR0_AFIMA|nr:acetate kinase [Afifella marina DSM 2698]